MGWRRAVRWRTYRLLLARVTPEQRAWVIVFEYIYRMFIAFKFLLCWPVSLTMFYFKEKRMDIAQLVDMLCSWRTGQAGPN